MWTPGSLTEAGSTSSCRPFRSAVRSSRSGSSRSSRTRRRISSGSGRSRLALWRLETMALMSDVDLPLVHLREQIASAVDVVVHMARLPSGRRVAFHVASVDGIHDGTPVVNEIFTFDPRLDERGGFEASGTVPKVAAMLRVRGQD